MGNTGYNKRLSNPVKGDIYKKFDFYKKQRLRNGSLSEKLINTGYNERSSNLKDKILKKTSTLSNNSITKLNSSSIMDNIKNMLNYLIKFIVGVIYPPVNQLNKNYNHALSLLYLIRMLFAIFIIVIVIWSGISGGSGTATPLYHLYSILKSVFVILMLVAGGFVVVFAVKRENDKSFTNMRTDTYNKLTDALPTEIAVLYSFLYLLPYMYDLVAIIILLGILKAYYMRGCSSGDVKKNPNVYKFIDIIVWGPIAIIFLTMVLSIIMRAFQIPFKVRASMTTISGPFMAVSFAMLILYFAMQYLEGMVTNNIAYWMKLYDGATSDEDCVTDQLGSGDDSGGFEKIKNIIISVILGILVLLVFVIQMIPFFGLKNVNEAARNSVESIVKKGVDFLAARTQ